MGAKLLIKNKEKIEMKFGYSTHEDIVIKITVGITRRVHY